MVPKRFPETLQLAAFREISSILTKSNVLTQATALLQVSQSSVGIQRGTVVRTLFSRIWVSETVWSLSCLDFLSLGTVLLSKGDLVFVDLP